MADSRIKNSSRNIVAGIMNKILTMILPFISRTIIIYFLGARYLGVGTLFTSILSFLSLAELGLSSAIVYNMYKPIVEENYELLSNLLCYYKKLYRYIGLIILFIGSLIVPFVKYLTHGEVLEGTNIYILYYLYLINSVISYFFAGYKQSLFVAYQRTDKLTIINTIITVSLQSAQIIFLVLTKNFYIYAFLPILFTLIQNYICAFLTNKAYPQIVAKGDLDISIKKDIKKKLIGLFGTKLNSIVVNSADSIIISAFLGLTVTAKYGNYYTLFNAVHGFIIILFNSITASIGNKLVTDTIEENYSLFKRINFLNYWLVGWCSICFCCLYEPFMLLWMGKDMCLGINFVVLMCIYFYIYEIQRTILVFKDAAGIWYRDRARPYVSMTVNLVSNIVLVQFIGIYGIILSSVLAFLISMPWANKVLFENLFKKSPINNLFKMLIDFCKIAIICLITYLITNLLPLNVTGLFLRITVCILVPNLILFLLFCNNSNLKYWSTYAIKIISKRGDRNCD